MRNSRAFRVSHATRRHVLRSCLLTSVVGGRNNQGPQALVQNQEKETPMFAKKELTEAELRKAAGGDAVSDQRASDQFAGDALHLDSVGNEASDRAGDDRQPDYLIGTDVG